MKILIVDDKKENLYFLESLLKGFGYEVISAVNGKDALEKLRSDSINMIISDILMPEMDGFQFLRSVKANNTLKNIPFIFYTATYTNDKDKEFGLKLGANKYIQKPIDPEEFINIIQGIIKDYKSGELKPKKPAIEKDEKILKLYSERLVTKLEDKMLDLKREVAERRKVEEDLIIALEKAEESDRLKISFLQNMSHEIRTPMNAIVGFSQLLDNPDLSKDDKSNYIKYIFNGTEHLLAIIDNVLELSSIETNQIKINEQILNINEILSEIYFIYKEKAQEKEFELFHPICNLKENEIITTDKTKFCQILINLLNNAFKFTEKGHIKFGCKYKENNIEFFVEDTGIGIGKEQKEQIYERFIQTTEGAHPKYRGLGLGLAICKEYTEMLGGKIWEESVHGKGSTFYFTVPNKKPIIPEKTVEQKSNVIQDKTILVVEDDEANFLLAKIFLERDHAKVIRAENGKVAVDICKENNTIDFVLMDLRMPVMDGFEATKEIKSFRKNLLIIAVTAHVLDSIKEKALNAGCDDFISKPLKKEVLNNLIVSNLRTN